MIYDVKRVALSSSIIFSVFLAFSPLAEAQLYKWVDETGKTVYSDQPPLENVKDQKTFNKSGTKYPSESSTTESPTTPDTANTNTGTTTTIPETTKPTGPKTLAEKELEFRKRRAEQEEAQAKAAKEQAEAKTNQEKCLQARGSLQKLESGGRVTKFNDKGEVVYLDDNERQREIVEAKKVVAALCK